MQHHVSPLINSEKTGVQIKPLYDDPYAYITKMDPLTRHEYFHILKKIEQGWITDRDIEIIRFLFVHRWMTLAQIDRLFFTETERGATARIRLNKMIKHGLIRKIQWSSYSNPQENKPTYYELGASGADILKYQNGAFLGSRDPRALKPTTMLFRMRYILTNEFYIKLRESFDLIHFEFHPSLIINDQKQIPTARFILRNPTGKELSFYVVCHREEEKWIKTLTFQAQFYKQYLEKVEPGAILIMLVSTDDKAILANKVLEQEELNKKVWFVTDSDLFNSKMKLSQGFFVFQNNEKVYYDLD